MRCVKRLLIHLTWKRFSTQPVSFTITTLVKIFDRDATIAGIRAALTQMQEFGVFEWKRKSEKPPNEKVTSTKMFHKAKGDEVWSRIVAREFADGVFAPEHHAGTPPTWALKLVISRMMSKGRTRQLASHDVSVAFFHAWLGERRVGKTPKDLRLNDDWLWYVVKALYGMRESSKAFQEVVREMYTTYGWTLLQTVPCLAFCGRLGSLAGWHGDDFYTEGEPGALDEVDEMILASFKAKELSPGASTEETILRRILRWSEEGVSHGSGCEARGKMASLLEVKGAKPSPTPSSRATGRGQRDVLELLTDAEATVFRRRESLCILVQTGSIYSLRQRNSLKTCRRPASCQC